MNPCVAFPSDVPVAFKQPVSLHGPDECAFLLDRCGSKVYAVNPSGAFLWRCLAGGMTPLKAAVALADAAGLPFKLAEHHVAAVLKEWAELRLIGTGNDPETCRPRETLRPPVQSPAAVNAPQMTAAAERRYTLLDTTFLVRFSQQVVADEADSALGEAWVPSVQIDCGIDVITDADGGIMVMSNGHILDRCAVIREVAPTLRTRLTHIALERDAPCGVLHAAALAKDNGMLLLPAPSGSGKSTLAAGLMCHGWHLLADDLVPLSDIPAAVRAFPMPICLKEGAWHLLQRFRPDVMEQPIFVRQDGKRVRYLVPETNLDAGSAAPALPVGWVIFTRYRPNAPTRLTPLPRQASVKRLLPQLFSRSGSFEPHQLDAVITLAERALCYELQLSSLEEGVALINAMTQ